MAVAYIAAVGRIVAVGIIAVVLSRTSIAGIRNPVGVAVLIVVAFGALITSVRHAVAVPVVGIVADGAFVTGVRHAVAVKVEVVVPRGADIAAVVHAVAVAVRADTGFARIAGAVRAGIGQVRINTPVGFRTGVAGRLAAARAGERIFANASAPAGAGPSTIGRHCAVDRCAVLICLRRIPVGGNNAFRAVVRTTLDQNQKQGQQSRRHRGCLDGDGSNRVCHTSNSRLQALARSETVNLPGDF